MARTKESPKVLYISKCLSNMASMTRNAYITIPPTEDSHFFSVSSCLPKVKFSSGLRWLNSLCPIRILVGQCKSPYVGNHLDVSGGSIEPSGAPFTLLNHFLMQRWSSLHSFMTVELVTLTKVRDSCEAMTIVATGVKIPPSAPLRYTQSLMKIVERNAMKLLEGSPFQSSSIIDIRNGGDNTPLSMFVYLCLPLVGRQKWTCLPKVDIERVTPLG